MSLLLLSMVAKQRCFLAFSMLGQPSCLINSKHLLLFWHKKLKFGFCMPKRHLTYCLKIFVGGLTSAAGLAPLSSATLDSVGLQFLCSAMPVLMLECTEK